MSKWFAVFGVCFLSGLAAADDGVIKEYAPADFEKFIKEALKKDFQKTKNDVGFEYVIKDTGYSLILRAPEIPAAASDTPEGVVHGGQGSNHAEGTRLERQGRLFAGLFR